MRRCATTPRCASSCSKPRCSSSSVRSLMRSLPRSSTTSSRASARSRDTNSGAPLRCRRNGRSISKPTTNDKRFSCSFFVGKGGVGKTTCAAAYAVATAAGRSVLVLSTDPAHSLADVLGTRLTARPRRVRPRLDAAELDAPRAFSRWLNQHRRALMDVLEHGTWLDRADIDARLDLPVPGVDEIVGLIEIARLASARYDEVVVDTAPTGHTLRLLAAPDSVSAVADVLDTLQETHRLIRQRFAGFTRPGYLDAGDRLIHLIAQQAADAGALLRDAGRTSFRWVTLPETLSIAESSDGIAVLAAARIRVDEIVVNRVLPAGDRCRLCDRRRTEERKAIARVKKTLGRGRRVRTVAEAIVEPRGVAALRRLAAGLAIIPAAGRDGRSSPARATSASSALLQAVAGTELLFVGGKGGVGKTTVAAAIALALARATPDAQVLLLSTDPAHSLGDVFDAPAGDEARTPSGAPANLVIRELDAAASLAAKREAISAAFDEIGRSLGGTSDAGLLDLAPPGIDELFGMLSVVDARATYGAIVVDTAPTGHALRLLEMPDAAREWVQTLMRVL